jgi:hypothetical protein
MSYSLRIYPDQHLVTVVFEGDVTIGELVQVDDEISDHPEYQISFCGVFDFRQSRKMYSPRDLAQLKNKGTTRNAEKGKWCSLNSTPRETSLAELFKVKRGIIHPFEVFSTVDAASFFLQMDLSEYLEEGDY